MKKKHLLLAFVLIFLIVTLCVAVACDKHTKHTFSSEWASNETHHWHEETCEHTTKISGKAEHDFLNGKCTCSFTIDTNGLEYTHSSNGASYSYRR